MTDAVVGGVDVGGRRKGFDVALLDGERTLVHHAHCPDAPAVRATLAAFDVRLAGVDAPRRPAADGERSRACERALARAVSVGIRWTPDRAELERSAYYAWVLNGLELYAELDRAGVPAVEVFPTASWTRWAGPRGRRARAAWTTDALARLGVAGVPRATSQDLRDAIAAAVTALQSLRGEAERFGEIAVPRGRP